jgi:hypothetical protein
VFFWKTTSFLTWYFFINFFLYTLPCFHRTIYQIIC